MARPPKFKRNADKRDGRGFVALPIVVLESPGYRRAGHAARSLLLDIAMQYSGNNNGRLTTCAKYLKPLGWKSNDTIVRARRELLDCGLLIETRKGGFPSTSAWFALSWLDNDQAQGLDIDPKLYRRGAYMHPEKPARPGASLVPPDGARKVATAPSHGTRASTLAPPDGAVGGAFRASPVPSNGAYLEIPSTPAPAGGVVSASALRGVRVRSVGGRR